MEESICRHCVGVLTFKAKSGLTQRAADGGYVPRFLRGFVALGFFPFRRRVPAPTHRS
jgi:hypothetical protein